MASSLPALLSGTLFGSALTASSVYLPSVILSQLSLTSTLMLKTFLTASACSAIIIYASNKLGYARLAPRPSTSYGWFGKYDANVVGGLLQGLGMAVTGACPGTVLVQVALGISPSPWVLLGGLLGGMAFVMAEPSLGRGQKGPLQEAEKPATNPKLTVTQCLDLSEEGAVLAYEILLVAAISLVDRLGLSTDRRSPWLDPVTSGCLIGLAQASSVLLSKKTLGVSSAYAELASQVLSVAKGEGLGANLGNIVFAIGVMLGARVTSQRIPVALENGPEIGKAAAVVGGFASIFGARLARGCTSGHGISGMSTLSISSFATVGAMFGGGIAFKKLSEAL